MLKCEKLVKHIISECSEYAIISEAVNVDDIRNMVKQMTEESADTKRRLAFRYVLNILHTAYSTAKFTLERDDIADVLNKVNDNSEFIRSFTKSLPNKDLTIKSILPKLADAIFAAVKSDSVTRNDLLKVLKSASDEDSDFYSLLDETQIKKTYLLQSILHDIDASRITDEDIAVYTPETFKEYNRKAKANFSYALFLKNNKVLAVAYFAKDGTINDIRQINFFTGSRTGAKNLKNAIENSDKIIAISNKYLDNIKHRIPYDEKTDDKIRRDNQERYRNALEERKVERNKNKLKDTVNSLIESIKVDLAPYKEKIMSIDAFDDDGELSQTFLRLKKQIQLVQRNLYEYINDEEYTDMYVINELKDLKTTYVKLMEILEAENKNGED